MRITLSNSLNIFDAPEKVLSAIRHKLTFPNPKWLENDRLGRWNGDTPSELQFYDLEGRTLIAPRGFIRQLCLLCREWNESFELSDHRRTLPETHFTFKGQLRPFQITATDKMLQHEFGTLAAPTGSGKTVMGLYMITQRQQPALIVVHTKELLNQWINRIETFLGILAKDVGVIGNGKKSLGQKITVATVQTLYKCANEIQGHIGHLVVDECHRAPSRTFTEAVSAFDCKYMIGLSATPWRRDKLSRLIFWHLGDVYHQVKASELIDSGNILRAKIITRQTTFKPWHDPSTEYSKMLSELTADCERNRLICSDLARAASNGAGICLVLSDRKSHCEDLQSELLHSHELKADVLTGDTPAHAREDLVSKLNAGKVKVLIATGQLIGEGFDCKGLSTLFLVTPIRFDGRVLQYLGRVLRPGPGKDQAVVYDYIDSNVGPLNAAAQARQRLYARGGMVDVQAAESLA